MIYKRRRENNRLCFTIKELPRYEYCYFYSHIIKDIYIYMYARSVSAPERQVKLFLATVKLTAVVAALP